MTIDEGQTYILTGYTVQCEGIVTIWELCYRRPLISLGTLTFYPGIWENTVDTTYSLIQSNSVTFNPSGIGIAVLCQNYTLPETEKFTAPSGSVVGLYSNNFGQLLRTDDNSQITTYQVNGNQNSVVGGSTNDVNYNIAIRVHFGEFYVKIMFHPTEIIQSKTVHLIIDASSMFIVDLKI